MIHVKNESDISSFLKPFSGELVTFFGSARVLEETHFYQETLSISRKFAQKGFKILTGGGGGVMEAGNRGAFETGVESIGLNVKLPYEQNMNKYVTHSFYFQNYSLRKEYLMKFSKYFVVSGGGFGTLDEIGEMIEKLQHNKLQKDVKVFFLDKTFYKPIKDLFKKMLNEKMILEEDLKNIFFVDNESELFSKIP